MMELQVEVRVDGELIYGLYPDGNVFVKHEPKVIVAVREQLSACGEYLEAFTSPPPTTACIPSTG